ncbi:MULTISPECIES: phosphate/phosphite/phosphonate ABC transporter substrate-binding protein [unclassified Roseovarius]|uniref:phosphate/phosphite/phosphonate ABC transporter substrate-binding protein n=1 Tax=unclassified Roseovarius TaxID=2614913 RepID=UPI00273ED03F|nr:MULTISPECIES: PhnD/SsuA/transferrin family substrate-binding protein [unclassified Roseovarius]
MIASLMMYARPELAEAQGRYWQMIRQELARRGIDSPETLAQEAEEFSVWTAPNLVLSQTCGMPFRLWLHDRVRLIGTPDFGLDDCPPGFYRSAFVIRADDARTRVEDFAGAVFAYNQTFSQSGFAAPYNHLKPRGFWFSNLWQSHGHLMSARAVAEGTADIAALDAVSWRLMQKYEHFAGNLRVLEWTDPTPGLPYIANKSADRQATFEAVTAAIAALDDADRAVLGLRGLVDIPAENYLAVPNPDLDYGAGPAG